MQACMLVAGNLKSFVSQYKYCELSNFDIVILSGFPIRLVVMKIICAR